MQFNKIDAETIEVSENGVIGYITFPPTDAVENIPAHTNICFDFKSGILPSLTLGEMREILAHMETLK